MSSEEKLVELGLLLIQPIGHRRENNIDISEPFALYSDGEADIPPREVIIEFTYR